MRRRPGLSLLGGRAWIHPQLPVKVHNFPFLAFCVFSIRGESKERHGWILGA